MRSTLQLKAIVLDVDGTLTDGKFWWGANGEELKQFSFLDVMGISLATKAGFRFALISGEESPLVDRFAAKMSIAHVYKGCKDKAAALRDFLDREALQTFEVCFMGDDINDVGAMKLAGFAAAPANATSPAKNVAHFVSTRSGGDGAVRELIDEVLNAIELSKQQELAS